MVTVGSAVRLFASYRKATDATFILKPSEIIYKIKAMVLRNIKSNIYATKQRRHAPSRLGFDQQKTTSGVNKNNTLQQFVIFR